MHTSHIVENSKHNIIRKEHFFCFIKFYLSIFLLASLLRFALSSADLPWLFKLSSHIYFALTLTSPRYMVCSSFLSSWIHSSPLLPLLCYWLAFSLSPNFLSFIVLLHQKSTLGFLSSCFTLIFFSTLSHTIRKICLLSTNYFKRQNYSLKLFLWYLICIISESEPLSSLLFLLLDWWILQPCMAIIAFKILYNLNYVTTNKYFP